MDASFRFFENKGCRYFPCHAGLRDCNCLFCYCPLYDRPLCPGNPTFIQRNGRVIKNCSSCTFPHLPEHYGRIMQLLKAAPGTADVPIYRHGGEEAAGLLDFSINVNPLGLSEAVRHALEQGLAAVTSYPDPECRLLRQDLAAALSLPQDWILCGNGASELLCLFAQALRPATALLPSPCFSGYERALLAQGTAIHFYDTRRQDGFALTDAFLPVLRTVRPDCLFVCSPGNPAGRCVDGALLAAIVRTCEELGTFCLVDECFMGFVEDGERRSARHLLADSPHLAVLDAFTKRAALPGVRLGYLMSGNGRLLQRMHGMQAEWSVSVLAQAAGRAALRDSAYLEETRNLLARERAWLSAALQEMGCTVCPGEANYLLFTLASVEGLAERLRGKGIAIRSCATYRGLGATDYRVAVRTHEDNVRLVAALREVLHER